MKTIRRLLILSSFGLLLSGGAAFAQRYRGGYEHGRVARPEYRGNYGGRGYYGARGFYGGRGYVGPRYHYGYGARGPIYVGRPFIREHYYNYYRRPGLLIENYAPMPGYVWVRGFWSWNGYEWIWNPGHYEPVY